MLDRDLPSTEPEKTASEKPSALLPAVHYERKRRKAAEARAIAAEGNVTALQQRITALELRNRKLGADIQEARSLARFHSPEDSLAAVGLSRSPNSGTISGTPLLTPRDAPSLVGFEQHS